MLSYGILVLEEPPGKGFVDDRYLTRGRGIVLCDRPAQNDPGPYGFEEPRHHARERRIVSSLAPGSGRPCTRIPLFQLSPVMGA